MLTAPPHQLSPGDRAPNFALPDHEGKMTMFYERVTGRPTVLLFLPAAQLPMKPVALASCETAFDALEAAGVDVFCITVMSREAVTALNPKLRVWADPNGKISDAFLSQLGQGGLKALAKGDNAIAALLDANQRLIEVATGASDMAEKLLAVYGQRPQRRAAQVQKLNAPVLVMPELIDKGMCADLMRMFDEGAVVEGTVAAVDKSGEVEKIQHSRKKRLDLKIEDRNLHNVLQQTIGRRVAPELEKVFNFGGFAFDKFLICRYAADREDRFRAHRDNLTATTQDRRFAMTLNLNADDYEGGELMFPEYSPDKYKTGNGGAVIFSCSLLHEALPVTKGVRYVLLTFLRTPAQQAPQRRQ